METPKTHLIKVKGHSNWQPSVRHLSRKQGTALLAAWADDVFISGACILFFYLCPPMDWVETRDTMPDEVSALVSRKRFVSRALPTWSDHLAVPDSTFPHSTYTTMMITWLTGQSTQKQHKRALHNICNCEHEAIDYSLPVTTYIHIDFRKRWKSSNW